MSRPVWVPELGHRIDLRHMHPMGAAIERNPERGGVGDAAPADRGGCLEEGKAPARGRKPPRRRNAGRPRPHNDHIDAAGPRRRLRCRSRSPWRGRNRPCRRRERRRSRHAGRHAGRHGNRGSKERPAIQSLHGLWQAFNVGRNRFIAPLGGTDGAIKRLRPTNDLHAAVWPELPAARKRARPCDAAL